MRLESATGEIALLTDTSSAYSQEKKSGSNVVWQSTRDKGNADQSVEHTEITATGDIQVIAAQGIRVEYRDTGNVDDSITQLAKQPGLAWMEQLRGDPRVNWQAVAEAHEKWDYKSEGLTGAGAALLSLAVAVATSGWGSGLAASLPASVTSALGTTGSAMAAAAIEGGFASLCSQAAVGLVNNKGDVLATLQGLASDQGLRALASAMLTASLTSGANAQLAKIDGLKDAVKAGDWAGKAAQDTLVTGTVQAGVGTALYGGDLGQNLLDGLRGAAVDALGAKAANEIGAAAKAGDLDYVTHKIAHAALGGAMAAADGKDAASGALGAVVGEVAAQALRASLEKAIRTGEIGPDKVQEWIDRGVNLSKLTAGLTAAAAGMDVSTAAQTGGNAAENNAYKTVINLIKLAYLVAIGKSDVGQALEQIGRGEDPLSQAIAGGVERAVALSSEKYPEETKKVLGLLSGLTEKLGATITYLDDSTGQVVSRNWNELDESTRAKIVGGIAVVGIDLPADCVKKIKVLRETAVELRQAERVTVAASEAAASQANKLAQLATKTDEAVFWSGLGDEGARIAERFATKNGGMTLEKLIAKTGIILPVYDPANPASVQAWREVSKALADGASGNVKVILGNSVSSKGIWTTIELPALIKNKNVQQIIAVDAKTGIETVIHKK